MSRPGSTASKTGKLENRMDLWANTKVKSESTMDSSANNNSDWLETCFYCRKWWRGNSVSMTVRSDYMTDWLDCKMAMSDCNSVKSANNSATLDYMMVTSGCMKDLSENNLEKLENNSATSGNMKEMLVNTTGWLDYSSGLLDYKTDSLVSNSVMWGSMLEKPANVASSLLMPLATAARRLVMSGDNSATAVHNSLATFLVLVNGTVSEQVSNPERTQSSPETEMARMRHSPVFRSTHKTE